MKRLFLGLNLWGACFLLAAAIAGFSGSRHHVRIGVFAAVFACLVQSGVIALFLGAAKLIKEHVGRFGMPLAFIDRLNEVYHPLLRCAAFAVVLMATAAIVGGLADVDRAPGWLHLVLAIGATAWFLAGIPIEFRLHAKVHALLVDVERRLPREGEDARGLAHPGYRPDEVVLDRTGKARALLYIGLTIPLPYLGYTFIVGRDVSFLLLPTLVLTPLLIGMSLRMFRSARRERGDG